LPTIRPSKGSRRELTAEDYVYSLKRHYDPRWKSANLYILESAKILGLSELRKKSMAEKKPFDYDTPVEGLRALDRYTFQIRLAKPRHACCTTLPTVPSPARWRVRWWKLLRRQDRRTPGGHRALHPEAWKRSSRIVLARNPNYREVRYDETAPAGDARLQAAANTYKGQRLPLLDEVHIAIIEEPQPRWLSFLNEEQDLMDQLPARLCAQWSSPTTSWRPTWPRRASWLCVTRGPTWP
jgi:ABC-type transport system substrate-binding protein